MQTPIKSQEAILKKLGIEQLNSMQHEAHLAIESSAETMLLAPTGTGKTLGFMLPIIAQLSRELQKVQALIIVPSRELALQIEQVTRNMGAGFKVHAFYGGQSFNQDRLNLKNPPAIIIATPGRIADHLRRNTFETDALSTLVLDEFDKSLEIGFESEMKQIISLLPSLDKKILTSATHGVEIPAFAKITDPAVVDYLDKGVSKLDIKTIVSPKKDKLETLAKALNHLGNQPGIVFCNFKDSIQRVSEFLDQKGIAHGCFYGGMEQHDRETALIKFRNGTHQLLLATDLAARGIDVPEIKFIIHYHLPMREEEFTHRNGRTARMHSEGTAYVLRWAGEELPMFIDTHETEKLSEAPNRETSKWTTLMLSGGRRDKISKGDIAGLFFKVGQLGKDALGMIELKQDRAFVAVHTKAVPTVLKLVDNARLKKKKVRVREV